MSKQDKTIERKKLETETLKELTDYQKNPDVGISWEKLQAYAHNHTFQINPKGHTLEVKSKIRKIQKDYKPKMEKAIRDYDVLAQQDLYEESSKKILELGLVDFNYSVWANHVDIGPTVLGQLANEVATFLVVQGGKAGFKHWQMLQKSAIISLSDP